MATLPADTVLGERFRIVGVLGRGGMATVYLADDAQAGERVALKLLHPHLVADESARRRLQRELAAAEALDHPGMLLAREAVDLDGQVGLVLPLHAGRTLAEAVAMDGPLPPDQLRRLGIRLAEALEAAHRAGVLHRDVTPRNVLVDDRGAPVLTDFGLARLTDAGTRRSTQLVGTTGFLAPEVLQGERADPRSDLYGLGGVLYLAATGRPPFAGDAPAAVMQRQLAGRPTPPAELVPGLPPWLDQLLLGLLDPDPAARPAGAAAVVDALQRQEAPPSPAPRTATAPPGAVAVRPVLPDGDWTVVVRESEDHQGNRDFRRAVRRRARHSRGPHRHEQIGGIDVGRIVDEASRAIEQIAGWDDDSNSLEARLTAAVTEQAELPAGALRPSPVLEGRHFHLVRGIDQDTAEALARQVRMLGLRARVRREGADDTATFLRKQWWALIPLMWIAFPALMMVGAPSWTVFVFVALTVLLSTTIGPWLTRDLLSAKDDQAPVAFRADLREALADGFVAGEQAGSGEEAQAPAAEAPQTRGQAVAAEALAGIATLDGAIAARSDALPEAIAQDLRGSSRDLRREVDGLIEDCARVEAELAVASAEEGQQWAEERLARLRTLSAAGQAVDPEELSRLEAAVAATEAAQRAESALDRRLTADLARLLEIAATARRLARELALEHDEPRSTDQALAELEERARAAAAARRELQAQLAAGAGRQSS